MLFKRAKKCPHLFIFDTHPALSYLVRSLFNPETDTLSEHCSKYEQSGFFIDNILGSIRGTYLTFEFDNDTRLTLPSGVPVLERGDREHSLVRKDRLNYFSKLAKHSSRGIIVDELPQSFYQNIFKDKSYLILNLDTNGKPVFDGSPLADKTIDFPRIVFMPSLRADVVDIFRRARVPTQLCFLKSPDFSRNDIEWQYALFFRAYKEMIEDFTGRTAPKSEARYGVYEQNGETVYYVFKEHLEAMLEENNVSDPASERTIL